jgi:serine/threonine protein kinase
MKAQLNYKKIEIKPIGSGSFGEVFLVQRVIDGKKLAMKVISIRNDDEEAIDLLNCTFREAFMLLDLKHSYMIEFVDAFFAKRNEICIVTEFAEGGSLYDYHKY